MARRPASEGVSGAMTAIDQHIRNFVQNWIADPLQFLGVSLKVQLRVFNVFLFLVWTWQTTRGIQNHEYFDAALTGLLVIGNLQIAVYGNAQERFTAQSELGLCCRMLLLT